jgi:ketosteroid isomerase-like protein
MSRRPAGELRDVRVHGDVAFAHGTNAGTWQGQPFTADEWVTENFLRHHDGWRCAHSALTPNYAAAAGTLSSGDA